MPAEEELQVSTLELFFDLVFVFTLTQLTTCWPATSPPQPWPYWC